MRSRELRNLGFVFVNDYFIEETGELVGIRADFLNEFRVLPVDFDASEIRHGVYLFIAGKRVLGDRVKRSEVSEEEVFAGNEKRMIWLSYPTIMKYNESIWMRLRVTRIPKCADDLFSQRKQRAICFTSRDEIEKIIIKSKFKRVYVLRSLMSGLIPIIFPGELKRYIDESVNRLYLGVASRYRSVVIYVFSSKGNKK